MRRLIAKKCHQCQNYWHEMHGFCPTFLKLQDGIDVLSKAMVAVHPDTEKEGYISVPGEGKEWLNKIDFDCKFFEQDTKQSQSLQARGLL
jgi:hypothetical protein